MKKFNLTLGVLLFSHALFSQLSNGIVADFRFNGNLSDVSPSAIVATNVGTTFAPDVYNVQNASVSFAGNSYISFNDNDVKVSLPITISCQIRFNSFNDPYIIFSSDNIYENYYGYWINVIQGTGQIGVNFAGGLGGSNSSNRRSFVMNNGLSINQWYTLTCIIRSHNDMEIHIDCEKQEGQYSGTGSTSMVYSTTQSRIGSNAGNGSFTNGIFLNATMDDFKIWNRSLSSNEITEICSRKLSIVDNEIEDILVKIYPNPTSSIVTILNESKEEIKSFQVTDLSGKVLKKENINSFENFNIDISNFDVSTYILLLETDNSTKVFRIVKY